jgi:aspartate/glutamate racemase
MLGKRRRPVVFIVHTSFVSLDELSRLFKEREPAIELRHIVDDSLLAEVLANGGVTPAVRKRMIEYYRAAELAGADLIFNQCSSVGEAADNAARTVKTPVIKVDSRMAEVACETGSRIGVVATLETTLGPTCRLIEATAKRLGKKVKITRCLVSGAFDRLVGGDRAGHNEAVLGSIRRLIPKVDVVVCAQGSMTAVVPDLGPTPVPVLTSPALGVEDAVSWIRGKLSGQQRVSAPRPRKSRSRSI